MKFSDCLALLDDDWGRHFALFRTVVLTFAVLAGVLVFPITYRHVVAYGFCKLTNDAIGDLNARHLQLVDGSRIVVPLNRC